MGLLDLFKRKKKHYHHILEVGDENFKMQVLQRSYKTPILVDYWAAWCGPCRQFAPVLERVAMEPDSGFLLAKLDTEKNRRTAARYNIRSIPAIKIFYNGQIVSEFTGPRLEHQVRNLMTGIIEGEPPTPAFQISKAPDKRLKQAKVHLRKGRGFRAAVCLRNFPAGEYAAEAQRLLPFAQFLWDVEDGDSFTGIDELDECYEEAASSAARGQLKKSLQSLNEAATIGPAEERAYTQKVVQSLEHFLA